uniref:Ovule protein n=1 Tax=Caenorhabditis tropicalis TaxID=1561998 RepID=A0A1I7UF43_9PELO
MVVHIASERSQDLSVLRSRRFESASSHFYPDGNGATIISFTCLTASLSTLSSEPLMQKSPVGKESGGYHYAQKKGWKRNPPFFWEYDKGSVNFIKGCK